MPDNYIYLALLHSIGISQKYLRVIFESTQNYQGVYSDKITHGYLRGLGIHNNQIEIIMQNYQKLKFEDLKKDLQNRQVKIITCFDERYPDGLKHISNAPFMIYLRGDIDNSPKIAVVGSRKMTNYGEQIITNILPDIAKYFPIVSGGAAGIDSTAHQHCMKHSAKTISVIGTGICRDYPVSNKRLYDDIAANGGGVISIFAPYDVGKPFHFPIRNEIIVGLSQGVWVVEAQAKSGSLITAGLALDMGKDVFSCPGDIFCVSSVGTNSLIQSGAAKGVLSSHDILEEYGASLATQKDSLKGVPEDPLQKTLYDYLLLEPSSIDDLSEKTLLDIHTLSHTLSLMEISSYIVRQNSGVYRIK